MGATGIDPEAAAKAGVNGETQLQRKLFARDSAFPNRKDHVQRFAPQPALPEHATFTRQRIASGFAVSIFKPMVV